MSEDIKKEDADMTEKEKQEYIEKKRQQLQKQRETQRLQRLQQQQKQIGRQLEEYEKSQAMQQTVKREAADTARDAGDRGETAQKVQREKEYIKQNPKERQVLVKKQQGILPDRGEKENKDITDRLERFGSVGNWFLTLCWMKIPIAGTIYILVLALRKQTPREKRSFAIAYILFKALVFLLAVTLLYILYKLGLDFVDTILSYMG